MGNAYNHHSHPHKLGGVVQKSTTFLPMICSRSAIKDVAAAVALPKSEEDLRDSSFSADPLSPKIGCMGQVKRNNKITGFPTTTTTTTSHNKLAAIATKNTSNNVKYFKLRKLFSGKNLTATISSTRTEVVKIYEGKQSDDVCINIFEMDPPLPVKKKVAEPDDKGGEENSLWKRRSGGVALKSLELQRIQIPRHRLEINTV